MHKFSSYTATDQQFLNDLYENSLFTTDAERDELIKDKSRVANALVFNFFGMLGLINATAPAQKRTIINFLKKDKKIRLSSIDDSNHDISLVIKLAHEAGFFKVEATVHQITKFLAKLKLGQIDHIDTKIAVEWMKALKSDFPMQISDPVLRRTFIAVRDDDGDTMDVSHLAVALKKRANKVPDSGDFGRFAKRFFGLTAIDPKSVSPIAPATPDPSTAVASTDPQAAATDGTAVPAAPVKKKSYYKSVAVRRAEAAAKFAASDAGKLAAKQAEEAAKKAEEDAKRAEAELKAKEEEENRLAKIAAARIITQSEFELLFEQVAKNWSYTWTINNPASRADLYTHTYSRTKLLFLITQKWCLHICTKCSRRLTAWSIRQHSRTSLTNLKFLRA